MKTILVPMDFSLAADNACRYAVQLAKFLSANVTLLNAVKISENTSVASILAWPEEDSQALKTDMEYELKIFARRLLLESSQQNGALFNCQPEISYCCEAGEVPEVVRTLIEANHEICLVAMGLRSANGISQFLEGSTTYDVIDKADFPLLIVPTAAKFKKINTIAFVTYLRDDEIDPIHSLVSLARQFNAELLLVHIRDEECKRSNYQLKVSNFLTKVCEPANYAHIYYRDVKSKDIDLGLTWLLEHREVEILVMVHQKHNKFERLFNQSHTQRMVRTTNLPVLVFPALNRSVVF